MNWEIMSGLNLSILPTMEQLSSQKEIDDKQLDVDDELGVKKVVR